MAAVAKDIEFDLAAPRYKFTAADKVQLNLPTEPEKIAAAITVFLLKQGVGTKYPQGMDLKEGRIWAHVLDDVLDDDGESVDRAYFSSAQFEFICGIVADAKFASGALQWVLALEAYLDQLKIERKMPTRGEGPGQATGPLAGDLPRDVPA